MRPNPKIRLAVLGILESRAPEVKDGGLPLFDAFEMHGGARIAEGRAEGLGGGLGVILDPEFTGGFAVILDLDPVIPDSALLEVWVQREVEVTPLASLDLRGQVQVATRFIEDRGGGAADGGDVALYELRWQLVGGFAGRDWHAVEYQPLWRRAGCAVVRSGKI